MAYSRFTDSMWYTFWEATKEHHPLKQTFTVGFHVSPEENAKYMSAEYGSLKTERGVSNFLDSVGQEISASKEELEELNSYIDRFKKDVENKNS